MFVTNYTEEQEYIKAKKRVEELKNFYRHLAVYIIINFFISAMKIRRNLLNGESFEEAFFDFGTFAVWIFWGIGIVFQALRLFGPNFLFGKDWERRKIEELMREEEDKKRKMLRN
ncbi:2TM domain-containing protein [uncultured Tenacibaculum sp.]|uniref:2TM domain-containing protein n=1 Tax=uncultured Tenacibaculum sp. TaxID=174713 RepID=UPI002607A662|nr:2TM domain-containing protein [uncultured Tenacibaculum sp.]